MKKVKNNSIVVSSHRAQELISDESLFVKSFWPRARGQTVILFSVLSFQQRA